jgi:hypothetical protein
MVINTLDEVSLTSISLFFLHVGGNLAYLLFVSANNCRPEHDSVLDRITLENNIALARARRLAAFFNTIHKLEAQILNEQPANPEKSSVKVSQDSN